MSFNKCFLKLIEKRALKLLTAADYFSKHQAAKKVVTRPLLGELMSQSIQLEELLDAYGARNNQQWRCFRSLMAAMKLFSDVSYEILHIKHVLPRYRLIKIDDDFVAATDKTLDFTGNILFRTCKRILSNAALLGLPPIQYNNEILDYEEHILPEHLPRDVKARRVGTVSKIVPLLSTAFLNLAEEGDLLHIPNHGKRQEYPNYIPDSISEEKLRLLQLRFHNLQSLYDTHVSETEVEDLDSDLPVLRGHISVVFHLLKTATGFAHYYERHLLKCCDERVTETEVLVDTNELLEHLMEYSIYFSGCYLNCAQHLCHEMLKRYAEIGQIDVPVPRYRGFHVRPSTLVSKIVLHYGSNVRIVVDSESYDAAQPLEIFRINEKINAAKRRWIGNELNNLNIVNEHCGKNNIKKVIHNVIIALAEQAKLVIYEQPLILPDKMIAKDELVLKFATDEIARLQAMGKIDIVTDMTIKLIGDKRVLADIELLAENGYGEDNFGNNIPLPKSLKYLRR